MTEERSPWARPDADQAAAPGWTVPPAPTRAGGAGAGGTGTGTGTALAGGPGVPAPGYRSGAVTRQSTPSARPGRSEVTRGATTHLTGGPAGDGADDLASDLARRNRLMMRWFGISAVAVVAIGLTVLLGIALTGMAESVGLTQPKRAQGPADTRSDLAKLCPPPSEDTTRGGPAQAVPPGPRTVDAKSGISYKAYGEPWGPWGNVWSGGTLRVAYRTGQFFVTERYRSASGVSSNYLASILSGAVPTATNDAMTLDLKCTGRQVVADVQAEYYPQPSRAETLRDEETVLGGRPAWVSIFRMHLNQPGLQAKDELVGVALIDVGRPEAAVLYISIPGTHHQFDHVVDEVLESVRPV